MALLQWWCPPPGAQSIAHTTHSIPMLAPAYTAWGFALPVFPQTTAQFQVMMYICNYLHMIVPRRVSPFQYSVVQAELAGYGVSSQQVS